MLTDRKVALEIPERQIRDLLIGREVGITVSEPWDFEYPKDVRMVTGYVSDAGADSDKQSSQWVKVTLDDPFDTPDGEPEVKIRHLKATRRHVSERGILEQLLSGEDSEVNLSYRDQVPAEQMPEGTSPFLIGTIALQSVWARLLDEQT